MAADLAVHHPGRGDDVGPGLGLGHGHLGVALEGQVVVDVAPVVEDAAVAVVGVLVEAQVGDEHHGVAELVARGRRSATWTIPSGSQAPLPTASLAAGTPKRTTAGTPSDDEPVEPP